MSAITVIGNVVTSPERKRTQNGSVTNFRVAETKRRFDSARQEWTNASTFFVDVECWGELGGNVSHSVSKGDPVVVVGAIRTHEWESEQGRRSRSQIKAEAVGHNLAKGTAEFKKAQRAPVAAPREDAAAADLPADEEFDTTGELVAGRDYEPAPETLHQTNADDLSAEPAHV